MKESGSDRLKNIMKVSVIGIITNVLLAVFKMIIGTITNSIAVVLDGVNNMADAASSLITIIGAAFAGKTADKKHPFGYGRMEYLSALVISAIVLYAGITSFVESIQNIIHKETSDYSGIVIVILLVAIVAKAVLAIYTKKQGERHKSDSLVAAGSEQILDVVVSISTVVAAIIFITTGLSLEAYLGAIISIIIAKAGVELLLETISKILGEPADVQLVVDVKNAINSFDEVNGAYDLIINNYGPDTFVASVHVETLDTLTVSQADALTRRIMDKVRVDTGVNLTAVGFYSKNTTDPVAQEIETKVREIALTQDYIKGMHGFYLDKENKVMSFDIVVSFDSKDRKQTYLDTIENIRKEFSDYTYRVGMDMDYNELA